LDVFRRNTKRHRWTNTEDGVPARNRALIAAAAALLLVIWQLHLSSKTGAFLGDFRAFYCAGAALAHGANPYAAASLYTCERTPMPLGLYHALAGIAVPAPLPGYALLLFVPFGVLPYIWACALWLVVLLGTSVISFFALARLLDREIDAGVWVLAVGFAVIVIPFGELGSLVMAAMLCLAAALRRRLWTAAAIAAAFAMILPHIGIPALLGVFIFVRPMRVRICAVALVLAILDVIAGGLPIALSYVFTVLPAHARAEIGSTAQYGLTWALHGLGAADGPAVLGGEISYVLMVVLGLVASSKMLARSGDLAYAALIPPAFAVFGGTFMHLTQIMIALPAALLLFDRARGSARWTFGAAAVLLAFPWAWVLGQPLLMVVYAAFCAMLARRLLLTTPQVALRATLGSVLVCALIIVAGYHFGAGVSNHVHGIHAQQGLAQSSWGAYIRAERASSGPVWWIAKAPTWCGLALLTLGCAYALTKKQLVASVAVEQVPVTP
jgi:hypothetical protein